MVGVLLRERQQLVELYIPSQEHYHATMNATLKNMANSFNLLLLSYS